MVDHPSSGFEIDNDEYKVMGLASYGKSNHNFNKILRITKDDYLLNQKIINKNELDKKIITTHKARTFLQYLLAERTKNQKKNGKKY